MKRLTVVALFSATFAIGCTAGPGGSSTSSSTSGGGGNGSSSTGGTSGNSSTAGSGTSGGQSSSRAGSGGMSSGTSGGQSGSQMSGSSGGVVEVPTGTPAEACAGAGNLMMGTNNGSLAGRKNGLAGCNVSFPDFGIEYDMGDQGAEQVWNLNVAANSGVRITLSADFDGVLYIRKGADCATAMLVEDSCADSGIGGDDETSTSRVLTAGQYWVVVDSWPSEDGSALGSYTLDVELVAGGICVPDQFDDEMSMNNNNTLPNALGPILTQRDDMDMPHDPTLAICGADQDWFLFYTSGGDVMVHAIPAMDAVGTVNVEIQSVARDAMGAPTGTAVTTGITSMNGVYTAGALPAGEYAVKVSGTGATGLGIQYGFNVLWTCEPDELELRNPPGPQGNGTDVTSVGPIDLAPADAAIPAVLCPTDVDTYWITNAGEAGDLTVKLVGGGGLNVTATIATVAMGKVTGSSGSATATIMDSGMDNADKTIVFTGAMPGANFLLKVEGGATAVPASGQKYGIVVAPPAPANDACDMAQAFDLPMVGMTLDLTGSTAAATQSTDPATAMCTLASAMAASDVFYKFTSPATPVKVTLETQNIGDGMYDSILYVKKATCTGMEVACNDDEDADNDVYTSKVVITTEASTDYFVVVDGFRGTGEPFELHVAVAAP